VVAPPLHAEVLACFHGVEEAVKRGMGRVILETDSQLVKLALESNSFSLAAMGGVVYELRASTTM